MVAFVSDRNCACCVNGGPASMWELYVVNIDGSGMQQVTPFVYDENGNLITGPGGVYTIAWSPDSKTLAYKGIEYGTFCGLSEGSPQAFLAVATINADGTNKTFLACDASGAAGGPLAIDWSPDGTLIADARDYVGLGGTPIRITDLTGEGRYAAGLTLAELGTPPSGDTLCSPGSYLGGQYNCLHFSPDSTQLAYINNTPSDDPTFSGISTINLDGTGRLDAVSVATGYSGQGIWWAPGPAIPAAEQITLTPSTVEVWPGFSQQLTPNLLDANGNVISHTASAFNLDTSFPTACGAQIGPYGFAMSPASVSAPNEESTISVSNEGLATAYAPFICWPSPPCNYTLTSNGENSPADGGPGLAGVIANLNPGITGSSCPWVTTSNAPWITITTGPDGSGTNNVGFTVAENTGPARQGAMSIAGLTFTVSQHAGVLLAPPALTFAAQKVGTTSAPQTLTLSNYLTSWLSLNGATMDGTNAKDFAMSTSCVSRLAPESSCSYVITFKPSVTVSGGERATLSISYGDGTLTAPLFGTGVAGPMSPQ